jgi:hypothetical protein
MISKIFLILICLANSGLVYDNKYYSTIPMPLNGWMDKGPQNLIDAIPFNYSSSKEVETKVGFYIFDYTFEPFESFVRRIQNNFHPSVIVFRALRVGGREYMMTDGKRETSDLFTPI